MTLREFIVGVTKNFGDDYVFDDERVIINDKEYIFCAIMGWCDLNEEIVLDICQGDYEVAGYCYESNHDQENLVLEPITDNNGQKALCYLFSVGKKAYNWWLRETR